MKKMASIVDKQNERINELGYELEERHELRINLIGSCNERIYELEYECNESHERTNELEHELQIAQQRSMHHWIWILLAILFGKNKEDLALVSIVWGREKKINEN